jgi:hypothetical protein
MLQRGLQAKPVQNSADKKLASKLHVVYTIAKCCSWHIKLALKEKMKAIV